MWRTPFSRCKTGPKKNRVSSREPWASAASTAHRISPGASRIGPEWSVGQFPFAGDKRQPRRGLFASRNGEGPCDSVRLGVGPKTGRLAIRGARARGIRQPTASYHLAILESLGRLSLASVRSASCAGRPRPGFRRRQPRKVRKVPHLAMLGQQFGERRTAQQSPDADPQRRVNSAPRFAESTSHRPGILAGPDPLGGSVFLFCTPRCSFSRRHASDEPGEARGVRCTNDADRPTPSRRR